MLVPYSTGPSSIAMIYQYHFSERIFKEMISKGKAMERKNISIFISFICLVSTFRKIFSQKLSERKDVRTARKTMHKNDTT